MASVFGDLRGDFSSFSEKFFFDTNIIYYIFGPFSDLGSVRDRSYSEFYKKCLENSSEIYINNSVISEFSNLYIKENYNLCSENHPIFKEFRKTEDYKQIIKNLSDDWYHILQDCNVCSTEVDSKRVCSIIDEMPERMMDFNDELIAHDCLSNDFILVTHDFDFSNYPDLSLVTGNSRLVSACQD